MKLKTLRKNNNKKGLGKTNVTTARCGVITGEFFKINYLLKAI